MIGNEAEQQEIVYNDFMQQIFSHPTERKKYPITFLGSELEMDELCLLYFYLNEIMKLAQEKGDIGEIIISLPEECEEKEIIQLHI